MRSLLSGPRERWIPWLLGLGLFTLLFPHIAYPISDGLDPSYAFALSTFLERGIQLGRDVVFTYGPLGFLLMPRPIGAVLEVATVVTAGLWGAFVALAIAHDRTVSEREDGRLVRGLAWLALAAMLFVASARFGSAITRYFEFLIPLLLVFAHRTGQLRYHAAAVALGTIACLAKPSIGVFCLAPVALYALYAAWRGDGGRRLAILAVGAPALGLAIWGALYGGFSGLGTFVAGTWELTRGYPAAMGRPAAGSGWWLAAFWVAFLALPLYVRSPGLTFLYVVSAPMLLGLWKYAMTRHFHSFLWVAVIMLALAVPYMRRQRALVGWALVGVAIAALTVGLPRTLPYHHELSERVLWPGQRFYAQVLRYGRQDAGLRQLSVERTARRRLPPEALARIGRQPIDFFPWELTYAYANDLHWRPHPTLQAYSAYTPWLDGLDAAFYAGERAPAFVLWHATWPGDFLRSTDERYVLNDSPAAVLSLLTHYRPVRRYGDAVLFERAARPVFEAPRIDSAATPHAWGEWIAVPASGADTVLRARLEWPRPAWRAVGAAIAGAPLYHVTYAFEDGTTVERRLAPDNAGGGVWVQPHWTDFDGEAGRFVGQRVARVRFTRTDAGAPGPIGVRWERLRRADGAPVGG